MKLLCALLLLFSTVSVAAEKKPAKIMKEEQGNFTNYSIDSAGASYQNIGCIPISKAQNTFTPADLLKGAEVCILQDNYNDGVQLVSLANLYANFDSERVTDESPKEAGYALYVEFFSKLLKIRNFEAKFDKARKSISKDSKASKTYCDHIKKIGYPKYYPNYMILYGINAFLGDPHKNALVKNFHAENVWNKAIADLRDCR
ncbi:MAG: hypothetical protein EB127_30890 [Alphaproteobacteria bacterium]|nr:hypothetical protein [Alphaproteobacteria bacterium]